MHTLSKSDFKLARTCATKLFYRESGYPDRLTDDPFLQFLARGGYMVEALAKATFPNGTNAQRTDDPAADSQAAVRSLLAAPHVTLFEATFLEGRRLARADIVQRDGSTIRLFEVKASKYDGAPIDDRRGATDLGTLLTKNRKQVRSKWVEYVEDVAYQAEVLRCLLPDMSIVPHLVVLDPFAVAEVEDLPLYIRLVSTRSHSGLERVSTAHFQGSPEVLSRADILVHLNVSDEVALVAAEVEAAARRFEESLSPTPAKLIEPLGVHCKDCEFRIRDDPKSGFQECWGELASVHPNVLELYKAGTLGPKGNRVVNRLIDQRQVALTAVPDELVPLAGSDNVRRRIQIEVARRAEPWWSAELKSSLERAKYPLHFVDFEAMGFAVPMHSGMRAYQAVAFQWSVHTVAAPGDTPVHREWLNDRQGNPNRRFAASLRDAIGDEGSIMTWSSFESTRLSAIAEELLPEDPESEELVAWLTTATTTDRLVDLHKIALEHFCHQDMGGKTSIKVVLDALWKSEATMRDRFQRWTGTVGDPLAGPYASLPSLEIDGTHRSVADGTAAMRAYEAMMLGDGRKDEAIRGRWSELLLRYCRLDTLAMVLIWEHWRKLPSPSSQPGDAT